jgi:hypothetical protein
MRNYRTENRPKQYIPPSKRRKRLNPGQPQQEIIYIIEIQYH